MTMGIRIEKRRIFHKKQSFLKKQLVKIFLSSRAKQKAKQRETKTETGSIRITLERFYK
jgi:hypothetical protein